MPREITLRVNEYPQLNPPKILGFKLSESLDGHGIAIFTDLVVYIF